MQNIKPKGQLLQEAYRCYYEPYSQHLQYAISLTLKMRAKIKTPIFENSDSYYFSRFVWLTDERLDSRAKYFLTLLKKELFGNKRKRKLYKNLCKVLAIVAIENTKNGRRPHIHLALGNIPEMDFLEFESIVKRIWKKCDFSNKEIKVKEIFNGSGWVNYLTKEVGYSNNDVLDVRECCIPEFIKENN